MSYEEWRKADATSKPINTEPGDGIKTFKEWDMKSAFHFYYKLNNSFNKKDRHYYEMSWKALSKEERAHYSIPYEH